MNLTANIPNRVYLLEQQTAKMAEGGRTRAKCELSIRSAFDMRQAKMSREYLVYISYCTCVGVTWSFSAQQLQPRPL